MTTHDLIERLKFNGGCQNLHCGDSSRCHACDGCRQNEAAQALSTRTDEVEELREAFDKRPALPLVYDTVQLKDFNRRYCAWENSMRATLTKAEGAEG